MPRDITAIQTDPDLEIPDLTPENAGELAAQADHIVVSFSGQPSRKYYANQSPDKVALYRWMYLWDELYDTVLAEQEVEFSQTTRNGRYQHVFIYDPTSETVTEIESFFESMVPLWSEVAISFCWTDHTYPRVNTLVYQLFDDMPPEPDTELFFDKLGFDVRYMPGEDITEEQIEAYEAQVQKYREYDDTETNPRYSFGLTHVLNGDYSAGGVDIATYANEYLNMDIRFLSASKGDTGTIALPSVSGMPLYETVMDELPDYPNNISVTEFDDLIHITEANTTVPLNPNSD